MARVVGDGIYFLLVDVVVAPAQQGNGIGKRILAHTLQAVKNSLPTGERCSVQLISAQGNLDPESTESRQLQAQLAQIQLVDKNMDMILKQVDTQQKAVSTEEEAVKKVIDKNIQTSFKTFA